MRTGGGRHDLCETVVSVQYRAKGAIAHQRAFGHRAGRILMSVEEEIAVAAGDHRVVASPARIEHRIREHDAVKSTGAELADLGGRPRGVCAEHRALE